jgi:hypothetical protein
MECVVAVADADPNSPSLVEARERLLKGIMATWPAPRAAVAIKALTQPVDLITIDLELERAARDRLLVEWRKAKAAKDAALAIASQHHTSPGDGYWQEEAKARARWIVAANFVEMLEGSHHADARQSDSRAART